MTAALKPCPFCKSTRFSFVFRNGTRWFVQCEDCRFKAEIHGETEEEAINVINIRPTEVTV